MGMPSTYRKRMSCVRGRDKARQTYDPRGRVLAVGKCSYPFGQAVESSGEPPRSVRANDRSPPILLKKSVMRATSYPMGSVLQLGWGLDLRFGFGLEPNPCAFAHTQVTIGISGSGVGKSLASFLRF